jgi:hypothetical protein
MGVDVIIPVALFIMIVCIVVGLPIARAYARRVERGERTPQLPAGDVIARLERIEQAIEAMAIEVERISEGQRFTTALLAEKNAGTTPALPPGPARHDAGGTNPDEGTVSLPTTPRPAP